MPITPFLKNQAFDPEMVAAMSAAFQKACLRLGLSRTADRSAEGVAAAVIRVANTGESDPDRMCRLALMEFGFEDPAVPSAIPTLDESSQARRTNDDESAPGSIKP